MILFSSGLSWDLKSIAIYLRGSVENRLVRYSFEKMAGKKGVGGQGLQRTLRWNSDFLEACGEHLGCIWPSAGSIQDTLRGLHLKPLQYLKGVFEWGVIKG
jgi:hypothetical protein